VPGIAIATPSTRPAPTDGELLRRLAAREVLALEAVYARYSPYVMGIALRILGNREEAEEVVQDVFWQLWQAQLRYDPARGRFSTWLFSVARFRCLDRLRARGRAPTPATLLELVASERPIDQEAEACQVERHREVRAVLAALPGEQRTAIELAFFQGLTHEEISERTGEALGTVKSRIRRGLARLRGALPHLDGSGGGES
jgi:RNA polymerase sigma-70 factor (ECF subfamily)